MKAANSWYASYPWYAFLFVVGGIAMVAAENMLFVKATAQQPPAATPAPTPAPPTRVQYDGKVIVEQRADGTLVQRTVDGKILQTFQGPQSAAAAKVHVPYTVAVSADPETTKLMQEEMLASQEAQKLVGELRAADSDGDKEKIKAQLREKLVAIFDMQQNRRAREVAKIEERLARLKETMNKRDTSKDTIIDRRLEVLSGGVDELGWEESFPLTGPNANRPPSFNPYGQPAYGAPIGLPGPAILPGTLPPPVPRLPAPVDTPPATPAVPAAVEPAPAPKNAPSPFVPRTTTGL
jgi:hypothetical protein